ncbi:hypothetical protein BHE74_00007594, partial [Ensete ventricosum]
FDGFRVPRENLLNSVADVLPDGRYVSSVENPDQVTSISKLSIFYRLWYCSCAMSSATNYLKRLFIKSTPESNKSIHVYCSAFKATLSWHTMRVLQDVLGLLRSMYALICTEEDASFLRYGYLSLDSAAAARKEVMKLCYDLRPHALSVVNSFGIPDAFLSPIAFDWVEANSWSSLNEE